MNPYETARMLREKYLHLPEVCIKVVPKAEPNADGVWRKVTIHRPDRYWGAGTQAHFEYLNTLVEPHEHVVASSYDLSLAGKPGSELPEVRT
jgi:hypothetical protein